MKQYIINLHYHKVKEAMVAQKILLSHEKVLCNLKTDGRQCFSFDSILYFCLRIKRKKLTFFF